MTIKPEVDRQTDRHRERQRDRQTDILITMLRTQPGVGEVISLSFKNFYQQKINEKCCMSILTLLIAAGTESHRSMSTMQ